MNERPTIFFDGECALCHGFVTFVIKRDETGAFQFAPIQGETAQSLIPEEIRRNLPDSVVLFKLPDQVLVRSAAVIAVLRILPGWTRAAAALMSVFPRPFRDFVYDLVAKVRRKIFKTPPALCPLVPDSLRDRILP